MEAHTFIGKRWVCDIMTLQQKIDLFEILKCYPHNITRRCVDVDPAGNTYEEEHSEEKCLRCRAEKIVRESKIC